ncbi:MAG TPA: sulfate ABC transporter permease subunit CysW [Candidatus Methylacidiphilales bacterium]|jgi:sulfate transport system permease protein|nr:sulfate ABC transporter permease subunit CysW [Candidatus Methylacidiphilales bacterium]
MRRATSDHWLARYLFIGIVFAFVLFFLVFPVCVVIYEALRGGLAFYFSTLTARHSASAIRLTLLVALAVVPMNTVFGVCAAWAVTHFKFRGKALLISLIEIPLWVSPVIGGLIFALIFGQKGFLGPWLDAHGIEIMFAYPGIVLATAFVTFPFVARGLIPLMETQGRAEEEAALTLGANGWQLFWRVTFPKIKWGVLYGMILCNARAMGEFGAVSVVAGSVDDRITMPLQIEQYYLNFNLPQAFALASLLLLLSAVTLAIKIALEWRRLVPHGGRSH